MPSRSRFLHFGVKFSYLLDIWHISCLVKRNRFLAESIPRKLDCLFLTYYGVEILPGAKCLLLICSICLKFIDICQSIHIPNLNHIHRERTVWSELKRRSGRAQKNLLRRRRHKTSLRFFASDQQTNQTSLFLLVIKGG